MIKVLLVIPAHGQNIFLPKMLDRLSKLSVYPTECRYVIDRPQLAAISVSSRYSKAMGTRNGWDTRR